MPEPDPLAPEKADRRQQANLTVIEPVTCLACGCLCDDIAVAREGDRVLEARNACERGREWFLRDRSAESTPTSRPDPWPTCPAEEAARHAAELLAKARAPVILGLSRSTNETVAAALELADRIGAVVDPGDGRASTPRILAFQRSGRVSATLGEVKSRADVVVFWRTDPIVTHPRHWERYSVEPRGRFVPEGRAGRTIIVVDRERTATAEQADLFVRLDEDREFETLWILRLGSGRSSRPGSVFCRRADRRRSRRASLARLAPSGRALRGVLSRRGALIRINDCGHGDTRGDAWTGPRPESPDQVRDPRHGRARECSRCRGCAHLADRFSDERRLRARPSDVAARRHLGSTRGLLGARPTWP